MYLRKQIFEGLEKESCFFWGARQSGKTTLLKQMFPDSIYIDFLINSEFLRFSINPNLLREIVEAKNNDKPVIIDEIQRLPELLNEVHWLIVNKGTQFILSGSSPRKIIRAGVNLLGGRALRYELYPLVYPEIDDFNLNKVLSWGSLPRHYLSAKPKKLLSAYIGSYLRDEIVAEAKLRNITAFTKFLESAAFSNGEIVNYSNIATDCGVSSVTVKEYFGILEDTLIGRFVQAYTKKAKRRVVSSPKFYIFDIGVANYLLKLNGVVEKTEAYGKALEQLVYLEMYAYCKYNDLDYEISYWRTSAQTEVDFVIGNAEIAIEVKATDNVQNKHLRGLKQFAQDYNPTRSIVVSSDKYYRKNESIEMMHIEYFLNELWNNRIINS
jgi:predicted AAA+ superfamily ATPase